MEPMVLGQRLVPTPTKTRRKDLEFLVSTFAPPPPLKVLEIGCGKGVNAWFFAKRGDRYTGMDINPRVTTPFSAYGEFIRGDFCESIPGGFDLICDRGGLCYNSPTALQKAVSLVLDALNPRGMFIAAEIYAAGNPGLAINPAMRPIGMDELQHLFAPFETLHLAIRNDVPTFDFVGRKR